MRYGVLGAGAVGSYYGGLLARAGHEVHFVVRGDYEVLEREGLHLSTDDGDFHLDRINVHRGPDTLPPCDVLLVSLKMTQFGAVDRYIPNALTENGVAVTLQNGLGAEEYLADRLAAQRIWGAICFLCAVRKRAGWVEQKDRSRITLAPFGETNQGAEQAVPTGPHERIGKLVEHLNAAGAMAETHPDLTRLRWRKLMWNIPYNGVCALLQRDTSQINHFPQTRALIRDLMEETRIAYEKVTGRALREALTEELIAMTDTLDHYRPSMLIDVEAGRPLELDAIYGEPLLRARRAGAHMPRTEMLYRLLQANSLTRR